MSFATVRLKHTLLVVCVHLPIYFEHLRNGRKMDGMRSSRRRTTIGNIADRRCTTCSSEPYAAISFGEIYVALADRWKHAGACLSKPFQPAFHELFFHATTGNNGSRLIYETEFRQRTRKHKWSNEEFGTWIEINLKHGPSPRPLHGNSSRMETTKSKSF
jgi:hypothetical protein